MKHLFTILLALICCCSVTVAQESQRGARRDAQRPMNMPPKSWKQVLREQNPEFFKSAEARRIGDQLIDYQRVTGGWAKNVNVVKPMTEEERAKVLAEKSRTDDSTTDNDATNIQLVYLARLYQATGETRYRDAFRKGVEYLLSGQYKNGGWPQFWPNPQGYQIHITYNDDAMANTLFLFQSMMAQKEPYQGDLTDAKLRKRLQTSFNKAIDIILKTQIVTDGKLTVWCQQHYRDTYLPAPARAYELPSYCSQESATLVRLLMSLPKPSAKIKAAVNGAMAWFDKYKIKGYRVQRTYNQYGARGADGSVKADIKLVEDSLAGPLWGRYYDLKYCEPYVCDRDGLPRRRLEQIGSERRNGYSWYGGRPAELYPLYEKWCEDNNITDKVQLDLNGPGANETGLVQLFRQPKVDETMFDAVVKRGESIQAALDKAPSDATHDKPYTIFIKKGLYNEKVIIDKPNIVLVGELRDSTIIVGAEIASKMMKTEYNGQRVHQGIVVLTSNANDCVLSGLTVYNNYGTTVNPTTTHQMAVYGSATRTIIVNCNINSDGNDALSLWAKGGGMYYHADLYMRCPGVDFICPRGTCYATRCSFYGDGRAILWHDGRNNKDDKFVITNSKFDGRQPTVLGRYHHDSQFYIVNCHLTDNIIDKNIDHAYANRKPAKPGEVKTDDTLAQTPADPCPWGKRIYYGYTYRDGGDSGWLANNLKEAPGSPEYHTFTAKWTFQDKWDPESRLRTLWPLIAY